MTRFVFFILIFGLIALMSATAITAEEIVEAVQDNQIHDTEQVEGSLTISDRFGSRVKTFISYASGADKMLLEFTNPEERGQKILRLDDEIYLYFPEAEEIIHLQGSALKESVMGSDFSYEDMTGERDLLKLYTVTLLGEEMIDGKKQYHLEMKAKKRGVAYPRQEVWVDAEMMALTRTKSFSLSGKPLKEMEIGDYTLIKGKYVGRYVLMRDLMKKNSTTEFQVDDIEIGRPLPKNVFSLEELTW